MWRWGFDLSFHISAENVSLLIVGRYNTYSSSDSLVNTWRLEVVSDVQTNKEGGGKNM